MDSNRRHRLSQNSLASWIGKQYDEWIRPNGQWIGLAALVIAALLVVYIGTSRLRDANRQGAWNQYSQALLSENREANLQVIAETTSGPVAKQARLSLAQILLIEGCNNVLFNKKDAEESLTKAIEHFQAVSKDATEERQRQQAFFGEAEAWETLAAVRIGKNDLEEAEKAYARVVEAWPDDYWGKKAKDRRNFISRPDTKKFFELAAARVFETPEKDGASVEIDRENPGLDGPGGFSLEMFDTPDTAPAPTGVEPPKVDVTPETTPAPPAAEAAPESGVPAASAEAEAPETEAEPEKAAEATASETEGEQ